MSRYELFDTKKLKLLPIKNRKNGLDISVIKELEFKEPRAELMLAAQKILQARSNGRAVVFFMGAHVLRRGVQRYVIDLMERGLISALAVNGAFAIHDYEFALIGATTESVAEYIKDGRFGLWKETGHINDIVADAYRKGLGFGEGLGKAILEGGYSYGDASVLAAGYRLGVPVTVHAGIGYDIIHQHPNFDGLSSGAVSHTDFLILAEVMKNIDKGVAANFGTAVMGPEVFLKALSMVRNIQRQNKIKSAGFFTLVCDIKPLGGDTKKEAKKDDPNYYFRPWKTLLVRTSRRDASRYVCADHSESIAELWSAVSLLQQKGE